MPLKLASSRVGVSQPGLSFAKIHLVNPVIGARYNSSQITDKLVDFDDVAQTIPETAHAVCDHVGYLKEIGLVNSAWWPADVLAKVLEAAHVYTGLPWWATIAIVTVSIRAMIFPLYIKSSHTSGLMSQIKPQLSVLEQQVKDKPADMEIQQRAAQARAALFRSKGIKLRYLATPFIQIPFALAMFGALRRMSGHPVDGFSTQGLGWFTDLSATDPYLGLQCITAAGFMVFMRLGGETGAQQLSPTMKKVFTVLPLVSIPFTMNLSAAVVWYFAVNSLFSIIQTKLLTNKSFRNYMKIAEIVPPPVKPDGSPAEEGLMHRWESAKKSAAARAKAQRDANEKKLKTSQRKTIDGKVVGKAAFKSVYKKD